MKATIAILALLGCTFTSRIVYAQQHTFRPPTETDRQIAKLAADWFLHDDWGGPRPLNAYSGKSKAEVLWQRERLRAKYKSMPLDIWEKGTFSHVLLTYIVETRSLQTRPSEPDPWPVPRLMIWEHMDDGQHILSLEWLRSTRYHLLIAETALLGPVIQELREVERKYTFRPGTERELRIAKVAADWFLHDDWGGPRPLNAYSGDRWKERVPERREKIRAKHQSLPVQIDVGTQTLVLLTYNVQSRSLEAREAEPDPWPTNYLGVSEYVDRNRGRFLMLRWGPILYQLLVEEKDDRITINEFYRVLYLD
ncbi:MAG: hypothetical protein Q8Q12_17560 [bacterium]|nr:hypothetical protein [bacterium]